MSIISYAQNFEDVILWRALKHIRDGFYIDVGASHPTLDSVTRLFYDNGWNGINIEPEKEYFELLTQERQRDINLEIAIGEIDSQRDFYISDVRGWSTLNADLARDQRLGKTIKEVKKIPVKTLDTICHEWNVDAVHFLKIDVEGGEKDVIQSFSFKTIRPWILVIEATKPTTQMDTSLEWEQSVVNHRYQFAYFDGINKFYVAEEHNDLLTYFSYPPNLFIDNFIIYSHFEALVALDSANMQITKEHERTQWIETEWQADKIRLEEQSTHWQIIADRLEQRQNELYSELEKERESSQQLKDQIANWQTIAERIDLKQKDLSAELAQERKHTHSIDTEWQAEKANLQSQINHWWFIADNFEREIKNIHSSTSWCITSPMRFVGRGFHKLIDFNKHAFKKSVVTLIRISYVIIHHIPILKHIIFFIIKLFPYITYRIYKILNGNKPQNTTITYSNNTFLMTIGAKLIFEDLKSSIETKQLNKGA